MFTRARGDARLINVHAVKLHEAGLGSPTGKLTGAGQQHDTGTDTRIADRDRLEVGGDEGQDAGQAVDWGREALAVLFSSEAGKVRLLKGDMVTPAVFGACIGKIDARLVGINQRLDRMDTYARRWMYVGLLLGVLLIVAQVGTPFLNAALITR